MIIAETEDIALREQEMQSMNRSPPMYGRSGLAKARHRSEGESMDHSSVFTGETLTPDIASKLSSRTSHFVLPKQWAAMRNANELERTTGKRVIHLEKGDFQGDEFRPAPHIEEACAKAIRDGYVRYVPGPGLPELRDAIAEEASRRGRPAAREEVLVTMGAKHALTQCLLTLVDKGDEVIFPNPGYPPDEFWITYAGGHVVYAPLVGPDFHFDVDALAGLITPRTKLLVINTPQRPNGMTVGNLAEISALCAERDVLVLSDEIFSHLVYPPASHQSITAVPGMAGRSILVDTFSKTYVMTGFRIGWCVADRELITAMDIFQQNSVTNVPAFVQMAALAALTGPQDQVAANLALLRAKRDTVVSALNQLPGVRCPVPEGSFYAFPDITATGMTAQQFTDYLIENYSVSVVAGTAFGDRGEGHVRITYAVPDHVLDEGLDRIRQAVEHI
jgi:aspartate/methionine/tyrosine aminotransferase